MARKVRVQYPGARYHVMNRGDQGEQAREFKAVRRGWCLGDKAFRKELLAQMQEQRGPNHYGGERFESDEAKALRIVYVSSAAALSRRYPV